MRILFIEDDDMLGKATAAGLGMSFAVDWVKNAEDAALAIKTNDYSMLVLDINLPGRSGLELLSSLRGRGDTIPCLLLTARDAVQNRVEGLNAGADDYLVKPFDLDELLARVSALIRRSQGRASSVIRHGDVMLDMTAKRAEKAGKAVSLSALEFAIAEILLGNIGRVISKSQIESQIYNWGSGDIGSNTVEVHISSLRRKLGKSLIKTIRNLGYTVEK